MNKDRFEAFSDGVFAFAITLLVLGIALPSEHRLSESELRSALLGLWPAFVAYGLSFAVIAIMWQNHQALFRRIRRVDRMTVFLNLVLLAGTAFIPFATSTLASYPTSRPSAFLYGLVLFWTATAYNVLLGHLVRAGAFTTDVTSAMIASTVRAYRTGWVVYTLAALLALWLPLVSFAAYVAIAGYYLVPRGVDSDIVDEEASSESGVLPSSSSSRER